MTGSEASQGQAGGQEQAQGMHAAGAKYKCDDSRRGWEESGLWSQV